MSGSTDIFCTIAREEFGYLISEFGFTASNDAPDYLSSSVYVDFDSPRVTIRIWWDYRDGTTVLIIAKADTFWIRPASRHRFDLFELLRMVAPAEFESLLTEKPFRSDGIETKRPFLNYCAQQLKKHAQGLLRGDLAVCEDMLITRYCETTKGIFMEEYFKVFRQQISISGLSDQDRTKIEAAFASKSPRHVYFTLMEYGQLRSRTFLENLNDFWLQYFQ